MAKKPQTEEKAKGLIGLSKGKKVAGAQSSVGNYRGRTLNLSAKQIAKSGVKGARSAARQGATSISDTKFEKGKGVTKGGKLFTGNVDLGGGNIAVYVGGKRVRAAKGKSPGGGRNENPNPPSRGASTISTTSAERLRSARNADRKTTSNYNTASRLGKPGDYQAGRGMTTSPSSTAVKRPIPYTSKGLLLSKENKLLNEINIEKQRLRQARERAGTKAEVSAAIAASKKRMSQLEAELRRLRSS